MNEQANNTHAAFMEVTTRKMEIQDKKIAAIEEEVKHIRRNSEQVHELLATIEGLRVDVKTNALQQETIQHLSVQLSLANILLKYP